MTPFTRAHPLYDASHNVIGLYNSSGSLQAAYAYDAFGNLQTSAGTYAASNPFRSATKYTDSETGFVYYGMRYYSPTLGRFINRDPIEEGGGLNLYLFCKNDGVNQSDYLGMNAFTDWTIAILNAIGSFFGNASSDVEVLDRMIVTPGEDDSNVSKPSDDSPGYLSMVASNRAVTDYQNENTMDGSAPNSEATTTPTGRIDVVETINPETRVHHVSYVGTYSDGRQFAIGFYPREIKDDSARVKDPRFAPKIIPGGIPNATDAKIRAGAMAMRKFASEQGYEPWNDNCGAAVRVGVQSAGNAKAPDYENGMISNTIKDPVIQAVLRAIVPF